MNTPRRTTIPHTRLILFASFMLACFIASVGLGTVWMRYQVSSAAARTRDLEIRRAELERRHEEIQGQIAMLLNPEFLQRKNREFGLGLVPTDEPQVIRVTESATRRLAARRHEEILIAGPIREATRDNLAANNRLKEDEPLIFFR